MKIIHLSDLHLNPVYHRNNITKTESFLEEARLDWVGFFTYSREEDTKSYSMRGKLLDMLNQKIAKQRQNILEDIQSKITPDRLLSWVGQEIDVLIEEAVKEENLFIARGYMDAPEVDGLVVVKGDDLDEGDVVKVKVVGVSSVDLIAEVVS